MGDVMVDALEESRKAAEKHSKILADLGLKKGEFQFMTVHRPSNTDSKENLQNILNAVGSSGETTVFPVHPRTTKQIAEHGIADRIPQNVRMVKPLGHMDTIALVASSARVLTDSGGLQKEAYLLGVPCITLRDTTEWVETVNAKWNVLVAADPKKILDAIRNFAPPSYRPKLFGQPGASGRIAAIIDKYLSRPDSAGG